MLAVLVGGSYLLGKKYDLYIFDLDGTIIDSHDLMKKCIGHCYRIVDKDPDFDLFFSMMGDSIINIFNKLDLPLELITLYKKISDENINEIKVFQDTLKVIEFLANENKIITIYTGKDWHRAKKILSYLEIDHYFDYILTSDKVEYPKPHPQGIFQIIKKFDVSPSKTLFIGDSAYDVYSSNAAKIDSVLVTWKKSMGQVQQLKPKYICSTPLELFKC